MGLTGGRAGQPVVAKGDIAWGRWGGQPVVSLWKDYAAQKTSTHAELAAAAALVARVATDELLRREVDDVLGGRADTIAPDLGRAHPGGHMCVCISVYRGSRERHITINSRPTGTALRLVTNGANRKLARLGGVKGLWRVLETRKVVGVGARGGAGLEVVRLGVVQAEEDLQYVYMCVCVCVEERVRARRKRSLHLRRYRLSKPTWASLNVIPSKRELTPAVQVDDAWALLADDPITCVSLL